MTLIDRLRAVLNLGAAPTLDAMRASVQTLGLALEEATQDHAAAAQRHAEQSIELLMSANGAAIDTRRRDLDVLASRVDVIAAALDAARNRVAAAEAQHARTTEAQAWSHAETLLQSYVDAAQGVQDAAAGLAKAHHALLLASEAAWQALPRRPPYRPVAVTAGGIDARLQMFLFGAGDGRLWRGTNAYVEQQRPDLVAIAGEAADMLLAPRTLALPAALETAS